MRDIDERLINSFDDDLGWLLLDLSDEEKETLIANEKEIERYKKRGNHIWKYQKM